MPIFIQLGPLVARPSACDSYPNAQRACRCCLFTILWALEEYAAAMDAEGAPEPHKLTRRDNGQWTADVWPTGCALSAWALPSQLLFRVRCYSVLQHDISTQSTQRNFCELSARVANGAHVPQEVKVPVC